MDDQQLDKLRRDVSRLRSAIDRAKVEDADAETLAFVWHWPRNCCDAPYLFILLYELGFRQIVRKCADVSHYGRGFERHVWIEVDGVIVDITADQFPDQVDRVIVSRSSEWHSSLPIVEERLWACDGDEAGLVSRYVERNSFRVYEEVLPRYATWD
jgi:hypothetical protein